MRFGGDYRRVHRDFLAGSNATGRFRLHGLVYRGWRADPATGSSIADFLLGLPQSTTLNSSLAKSYLRDNVFDAYAMDDWRMLPRSRSIMGCAGSSLRPTPKNTATSPMSPPIQTAGLPVRPKQSVRDERSASLARLSRGTRLSSRA